MNMNTHYTENPYTPSFGMAPSAYIHRDAIESKPLNRFCSPTPTAQSYMIMGARGTGKTVLMHEMAKRFESFDDWIVVRMNPNVDMLDALMRKLAGHHRLASMLRSANINLSFFGLGVEIKAEPIRETEDAITAMVKCMRDNEERLLIIIDEATNTPSMKAFASAYQNLIGQDLPVYLLMTGLYENINRLRDENNLTFLYRMPRLHLGPLDEQGIAENYREVFGISDLDAMRMAALTKGYSYAFQLLGDMTWEAGGRFTDVLDAYRSELFDVVYEKIWSETSPTDRDVLYSIAKSDDGKVQGIRELLDKSSNEFSPYSDKLKKKGIIGSSGYGSIHLVLPFFKGFILRRYTGRLLRSESLELPEDL